MAGSTDLEQLMLEYINEARIDPLGDAARFIASYSPLTSNDPDIRNALNFFGVDGSVLLSQLSALTPVQPLAWNDSLAIASRQHSGAMIAADTQSHQLPGEADLSQRDLTAGYTNFSALGENVFAFATSVLDAQAGFMVDWGPGPSGMQSPPGHRTNIMSTNVRELGIGILPESNPSTSVGPLVVTEDFGARFNSGAFVLGTAYNDTDHNNFYSPGEGLGSLVVTLGGASATSWASGGFTLNTAAIGGQTVTFSGAGLAGTVIVALNLTATSNVMFDIVNGTTIETSTSVNAQGPFGTLSGLGVAGLSLSTPDGTAHAIIGTPGNDAITGGSGDDTLTGRLGSDMIDGGPGTDSAVFSGPRSGYTLTALNGNGVQVSGVDGVDTLTNVERLVFDDQTVTWPPSQPTPLPTPLRLVSTLADFGWAQGWNSSAFTRLVVADQIQHASLYVGFGAVGTILAWGVPGASPPALAEFFPQSIAVPDFGTNQGYDAGRARGIAVYGTGNSNGVLYQQNTIYGQGNAGVYFYRPVSAVRQANGVVTPTYETSLELYRDFGTDQGWTHDYNFQPAVTTHATPDIVGFGIAGMLVAPQAFLPGAGPVQEYFAANSAAIGNAAGWTSMTDVRTIIDENGKPIDLNGDGTPDFVGMGPHGLNFAFGVRDGAGNYQLGTLQTAHISGSATDLGDPQGWSKGATPRIITDINNDGRADIVAFGAAGALVSLGQDPAAHGGEPFGQLYLGIADFGLGQGWTVALTPRFIADVNGDHIADIVGFGASSTFTAFGSVDAAGRVHWAPGATINDFGYTEGWAGNTFRGVADISGSGHADLVLSGAFNTQIWHYS
jgi:hypothetical protein